MEMVSGGVLWVGLGQQRSRLNSFVEFASNMPEIGRSDFESLSFTHAVAQLVGSLQILVAECEITSTAGSTDAPGAPAMLSDGP